MTTLPDFDALWNYDDPAETENRFRELLPVAEASGDVSYHAQLLTQIARTLGLQRQFDEAHQTLDAVEKMLTDSPRHEGEGAGVRALEIARVRYLLERGRALNSSKHPDEAKPLFVQAWELAQQVGDDGYAVDAAHMIAIVEEPEQMLAWNLKALDYAEKSQQPRGQKWLGSLYNNIGWKLHDMGQHERALEIFQKAVIWREANGSPANTIRIARWCVARTLRSLNRIDEALAMQRDLLKEAESTGGKDGYTHEELGELLLMKGSDEAQQHFALAYQALSQDPWLAENEPERLARLKKLGGITT
jgi:tetratricopeptide (TPR) repeat protein